jgi:uncharacterized protein (DUF2141 family)
LWYIVPSFIEVQGEFYKHKEDAMRQFALFLVASLLILLTGCDGDFPTADSAQSLTMGAGTIRGTVYLEQGTKGTLANTVVQLYSSSDDMNSSLPRRTILTGQNGEFVFDGVCCGTYTLGVWKDNDGNGVISSGDYSLARSNAEENTCVVTGGCTTDHLLFAIVVQ